MSSHEKLAAAANDRKARLAQLKSLKRKQAPTDDDASAAIEEGPSTSAALTVAPPEPVTKSYLSGRNYDTETRNVKLGFETAPIVDTTSTLEYKAGQLALETKLSQKEEEKEDKPLDLFKLQPKKPNWDLKRDLENKLKPMDVWTENSIARIVRERIEAQKEAATRNNSKGEDGEEVGMEGEELVEVMHLKEREEEAARKREDDDETEDVS